MKSIKWYPGIIAISIAVLNWSCFTQKNPEDHQHIVLTQVLKGGCFQETDKSPRSSHLPNDSLHIYIKGDTLNMWVGLGANCCSSLKDSIQVSGNSVTAFIVDKGKEPCRCNCYFTYNFQFKNFDRGLTMGVVKLKGYQENDYRTILTDSIK